MNATVNVRHSFDYTQLNHQLYGKNSGVVLRMFTTGLRVQGRARRKAPAKTGRLRVSIQIATEPHVINGVNTFAITVGTNLNYAQWVHDGTGIYGPHHTPILPHGRVLQFVSKKTQRTSGRQKKSKVVVTAQVKGQKAVPFLTDALAEVTHHTTARRAAQSRGL